MGIYTLKIVGESYRQESIQHCSLGDPLVLKREPENKHDENAVAVLRKNGEQIGYLSRKDAEWVARIMDMGDILEARIKFITGSGKGLYGVVIDVNTTPERGWEGIERNNQDNYNSGKNSEKEIEAKLNEKPYKSFWRKFFRK